MYANDILRHHCENATGTLLKCVEENTFGLNETIHSAHLWHSKDKTTPLAGSKVWKTHLTSMQFGRGYTMRFDWNSSADYDQVYLLLNQSLEYTIFIHDHNYFLVSRNPLAMPTLYVTFNPNQTFSHYERLLVTEHQLLENCEPDPGYSFQACVQQVPPYRPIKMAFNIKVVHYQSLERRLGCNLPWSESISNKEGQKCETFQSYRLVWRIFLFNQR